MRGTPELCDAWTEAHLAMNPDFEITAADKATFEWAFACSGLDDYAGATSVTVLGATIVAAFAALVF